MLDQAERVKRGGLNRDTLVSVCTTVTKEDSFRNFFVMIMKTSFHEGKMYKHVISDNNSLIFTEALRFLTTYKYDLRTCGKTVVFR